MRLPIILMLLTVLLLPADLEGFAAQIQSGVQTAQAAVTKFLDRGDQMQVAEAGPKLTLGGKVTEVR
jgi:hypothetical protein